MTAEDMHDLLECFGQEQACYTTLLNLSRRQRQVIETGELDELFEILSQKQTILSRLGIIESLLQPYKRQWSKLREELSSDDRQVLDMALATVEELLAELIGTERQSEELLIRLRDGSLQELQKATKGQQVHRTYQPPAAASVLVDRRSI